MAAPDGRALKLLADLVDADPCWFDHNGDCQAHGFFGLRYSGQNCAHQDAKDLLDEMGVEWK
jgi:hypothetical protein